MKKNEQNSATYIRELEDKIVDLSLKLKVKNNHLKTVEKESHERIRKIVHNLKNPIGVAYSFSEMIADNSEKISKEKLDKYIDVIKKSTDFSIEFLNSLAALNRLISPNFKPNLQKTNYVEFLKTILSEEKTKKSFENNVLNLDFPNTDVYLNIDINEIALVVKNLLSNALRFSSNNTEILIQVVAKEDVVETTIIDQGIGILESNLALIFNEFYAVNTYCEKNNKCIGLGLAIAKLIIQHHNGEIEVNSTLGNGSTFKFSVPKS